MRPVRKITAEEEKVRTVEFMPDLFTLKREGFNRSQLEASSLRQKGL